MWGGNMCNEEYLGRVRWWVVHGWVWGGPPSVGGLVMPVAQL